MASLTERVIGAAKLDAAIYEDVEADEGALAQAMLVVVAAAVAAGVGQVRAGVLALVGTSVVALIGWFVWAAITWLVGTKLLPEPQTEADLGQLLRTIGFSSAPGLLRVFGGLPYLGPFISFAAGVWMLVAMVVAVRQALDYTGTGRAVVVCLIGWVVYMLTTLALVFALFTAGAVAGALAR